MAITSTYPIILPKPSDLIVGTQTYTSANPVLDNPTRNFTVQSIIDLVPSGGGGGSGTVTSLTTTGTSGAATLASGVLNIPNYTTNAGTVTDVQTTNGAGISTSVINSTSAPNITITNTDLGSSQNIFKNFAVSGQTTIAADSNDDTLTLVAGSNITITTDAITDAITINATSSLSNFANDIVVNGLTVGRGDGDNSTNTAFGFEALENNTFANGGYNVAIGRRALLTKGSGSFNTAVGAQSMSGSSVAGNRNIGLGYNSLTNLSSGSENIGIGYAAQGQNLSGDKNIAIGSNSMDQTQSNAVGNVAVGYHSLYYLQDGEHNVAIGLSAGVGGASNYTANDCIFIGERASPGGIGYTNQIVIGTTAAGKGANTAVIGNSSITELHVGGDGAGIVLKSPNGTAYKITVTDAGALVVT
tara:strand:- start:10 stop:1257 length:1248 start_codon:yes stop_codon:yes gene_type:complete